MPKAEEKASQQKTGDERWASAKQKMFIYGFRDGAASHLDRSDWALSEYGPAVRDVYLQGYARGKKERLLAMEDAEQMFG